MVFMGFFAMMNPISNTPIFISVTQNESLQVKRQIALRALIAAFLVVLLFVLLGKVIFQVFGITLPAFQITGGILISVIGFNMIHGQSSKIQSPRQKTEDIEQELDVAISPLAIPILSGPGTITTAVNFASTGGVLNLAVTIIAFALLCLITFYFFIFGERIAKFLGRTGMNMITRLMGLLLSVIGVQMLIGGIKASFHLQL